MTSKFLLPSAGLLTLLTMAACGGEPATGAPAQNDTSATLMVNEARLSDKAAQAKLEKLGSEIYFDTNLSNPPGQSCASCHLPTTGFADPDHHSPTSQGAVPGRFGSRNAPTAAYMQFATPFRFDPRHGGHPYLGGLFWDGRVSSLEDQAKLPLLNPVEMNNPDKASVVNKIRQSSYAHLFRKVFGDTAFDDVDTAYDSMAQAIAAFERTPFFAPFTSKYDAYLAGKVQLTAQEQRGLELFNDPERADCGDCHPSGGAQALFTNFNYNNIGVPRNPHNRFYKMPPEFNPEGENYVDHGLGGILGTDTEQGKFRVPTLRNVALTAPYMHNGYFKDLHSVVAFYNTRDVPEAGWPAPEMLDNMDETVGNLGLSDQEVDDIVAFLNTLTDGYMK